MLIPWNGTRGGRPLSLSKIIIDDKDELGK